VKRLFDVDESGKVELDDNTFLLIPELKQLYQELGYEYVCYVINICDYYSPYRQLIGSDKRDIVIEDMWGKTPDKKSIAKLDSLLVKEAIAKYKRLQYDPHWEQYITYTEKIAEYNEVIKNTPLDKDSAKILQNMIEGQQSLSEAREELKSLIIKNEESKVHGGGEASFLEQFIV
jgi:hypothetical protein